MRQPRRGDRRAPGQSGGPVPALPLPHHPELHQGLPEGPQPRQGHRRAQEADGRAPGLRRAGLRRGRMGQAPTGGASHARPRRHFRSSDFARSKAFYLQGACRRSATTSSWRSRPRETGGQQPRRLRPHGPAAVLDRHRQAHQGPGALRIRGQGPGGRARLPRRGPASRRHGQRSRRACARITTTNYYGAFVLDPDGHNIEAVCHLPE